MAADGDPYRKLFNPKHWVERWVELKGQPFLEEAKENYPATNSKGKVGFFVGCYMNRRQQNMAVSTMKALNDAHYDVIVPKNQLCCGQPLMRLGMVKEAKELLLENISIFEKAGVTEIVTACPDCSYAFSEDYVRIFGNGDRKPSFKISDLITLLPPAPKRKEKNIACHNPCYLSKQGISLSEELKSKGIQVEEVIEDCCGAGGGVYFTRPELSQKIGKKTAQLFNSGTVICGCPFCKEQLEQVTGNDRKVIHYVELWNEGG
jgi:fumarate reductase (CoM/CoB) subunit B